MKHKIIAAIAWTLNGVPSEEWTMQYKYVAVVAHVYLSIHGFNGSFNFELLDFRLRSAHNEA